MAEGKCELEELTIFNRQVGETVRYCGLPAVDVVTVACVHEHIERTWLCPLCLEKLRRRELSCTFCWHAKEPHSCESFEVPAKKEENDADRRSA